MEPSTNPTQPWPDGTFETPPQRPSRAEKLGGFSAPPGAPLETALRAEKPLEFVSAFPSAGGLVRCRK